MKTRALFTLLAIVAFSMPAFAAKTKYKHSSLRLGHHRTIVEFGRNIQDVDVDQSDSSLEAEIEMQYWSNSEISGQMGEYHRATEILVSYPRGRGRTYTVHVGVDGTRGHVQPRTECLEFDRADNAWGKTKVQGICLAATLTIPSVADYRFITNARRQGIAVEIIMPRRPTPPPRPPGRLVMSDRDFQEMYESIDRAFFQSDRIQVLRDHLRRGDLLRADMVAQLFDFSCFHLDSDRLEALRTMVRSVLLERPGDEMIILDELSFSSSREEARRILRDAVRRRPPRAHHDRH